MATVAVRGVDQCHLPRYGEGPGIGFHTPEVSRWYCT